MISSQLSIKLYKRKTLLLRAYLNDNSFIVDVTSLRKPYSIRKSTNITWIKSIYTREFSFLFRLALILTLNRYYISFVAFIIQVLFFIFHQLFYFHLYFFLLVSLYYFIVFFYPKISSTIYCK